mgnify:CR=1 FL=1
MRTGIRIREDILKGNSIDAKQRHSCIKSCTILIHKTKANTRSDSFTYIVQNRNNSTCATVQTMPKLSWRRNVFILQWKWDLLSSRRFGCMCCLWRVRQMLNVCRTRWRICYRVLDYNIPKLIYVYWSEPRYPQQYAIFIGCIHY